MLRRGKLEAVRGRSSVSGLALELAKDRRFRRQLLSALEHSTVAARRTRRGLGLTAALTRLANDPALRSELRRARVDLQRAYGRLEKKRTSHKLRNLTLLAALAAVAGVPQLRRRVSAALGSATKRRQGAPDFPVRSRSNDSRGATSTSANSLEDLSKEELYQRAQDADIPGRSEMSKAELADALRRHS